MNESYSGAGVWGSVVCATCVELEEEERVAVGVAGCVEGNRVDLGVGPADEVDFHCEGRWVRQRKIIKKMNTSYRTILW